MDKIHLEAMASVHLQQYPVLSSFNANKDVTDKMDIVRKICSSVLFIRKKHNIRTRMPLEYIKIVGLKHAIFHDFEDIIKNETNVKSIFFIEFNNIKIEKTAKLNFKSIGTKFGNNVSQITSLVKASKWTQNNDGDVIIGDFTLKLNEDISITLQPSPDSFDSKTEDYVMLGENVIVIKTQVNAELEQEAISRDFIRAIQTKRKDLSLNLSDKISIKYFCSNDIIKNSINKHSQNIKEQVLASVLIFSDINNKQQENSFKVKILEEEVRLEINV